jgi:hypothetical protein
MGYKRRELGETEGLREEVIGVSLSHLLRSKRAWVRHSSMSSTEGVRGRAEGRAESRSRSTCGPFCSVTWDMAAEMLSVCRSRRRVSPRSMALSILPQHFAARPAIVEGE